LRHYDGSAPSDQIRQSRRLSPQKWVRGTSHIFWRIWAAMNERILVGLESSDDAAVVRWTIGVPWCRRGI